MGTPRLDNVGIVVDDLDATVSFFTTLGLRLEGRAPVEGAWADRVAGLDGIRLEVAMMRTSDGHGRLELMSYRSPSAIVTEPKVAPPHALGLRRIMFAVDDLDEVLDRLRDHGAELIGEVVQYEHSYRLCYLRGPEGIIVALSQRLG